MLVLTTMPSADFERWRNPARIAELDLETGEVLPGDLRGDKTRFIQVLVNLVKNALKFA